MFSKSLKSEFETFNGRQVVVIEWGMSEPELEAKLALKVHPGAKRNQITSVTLDLVDVKVAAPADKGKANSELLEFLAEMLGLPKSRVRVIRGEFSRNKLVSILGLTKEDALSRLGRLVATKGNQGALLPRE